jgi:hypothetical protein
MVAVLATWPEIQRLIAGGSSLTDFQDMATEQATCPEIQRLIAGAAHSKLIFRSVGVTDWQGTAPQVCGERWCCYRQNDPLDGGTSLANTAAPRRGQPWQEPPAATVLTPPPAAADPGTFFPGKPARCFARPGEAYSSRYPQRNRRLPAWHQDYTFFAASRDQEAGGSSLGTPCRGCLRPSTQQESSM